MKRKTGLHAAFIDVLRDAYDAELQMLKSLPRMCTAATSAPLRRAFETHMGQTRGQIERLEAVFSTLDETLRSKHCDGISGIITESRSLRDEDFDVATMDACLIGAGQRTEHYQIAAYGTLVAWARTMGHSTVADLLQETLDEERAADALLSELAEGGINQEAAGGARAEPGAARAKTMARAKRSK